MDIQLHVQKSGGVVTNLIFKEGIIYIKIKSYKELSSHATKYEEEGMYLGPIFFNFDMKDICDTVISVQVHNEIDKYYSYSMSTLKGDWLIANIMIKEYMTKEKYPEYYL